MVLAEERWNLAFPIALAIIASAAILTNSVFCVIWIWKTAFEEKLDRFEASADTVRALIDVVRGWSSRAPTSASDLQNEVILVLKVRSEHISSLVAYIDTHVFAQ